jgi:hypothetical protein
MILPISVQLNGPNAEMLRDFLRQEKAIEAIDLKEVLLVNREAGKLLALAKWREPNSKHCAAYICEWVPRETLQIAGTGKIQRTEEKTDTEKDFTL